MCIWIGPDSDSNRGNSCYRARGWPIGAVRIPKGGPRKGPGKEAAQEKSREAKGRCVLCLRKRKEGRKKKGSFKEI
jgi:hypothetical protein